METESHSEHAQTTSHDATSSAPKERLYMVVYRTKDGTRHENQILGHGHHEAVAKARENGATEILHVSRVGHHTNTIKVKKSRMALLFKVAAALLVTALAYFLIVSLKF